MMTVKPILYVALLSAAESSAIEKRRLNIGRDFLKR